MGAKVIILAKSLIPNLLRACAIVQCNALRNLLPVELSSSPSHWPSTATTQHWLYNPLPRTWEHRVARWRRVRNKNCSGLKLKHISSNSSLGLDLPSQYRLGAECDVPVPGIPGTGNFSFFWWYRNRYRKNLVPRKSLGTGISKIWYRKKVSELVAKI